MFRLALAAIHHNENSARKQIVDADGKPRYTIKFPKVKKGQPSVRPIKPKATYGKEFMPL